MAANSNVSPAWARAHDLIVMRQVLAKLMEAEDLVNSASIALDNIPAGIAAHEGANASQLVDVAADRISHAVSVLEEAINARRNNNEPRQTGSLRQLLARTTKCPRCEGTGCSENGFRDCEPCNGTGRIARIGKAAVNGD